MTKAIIDKHYQAYLDNAYGNGLSISVDHREGSIRISTNELNRLRLKSKLVCVPSNSLVIANVGGFHQRSIHRNNVVRHAIHSSIRPAEMYSVKSYRSN